MLRSPASFLRAALLGGAALCTTLYTSTASAQIPGCDNCCDCYGKTPRVASNIPGLVSGNAVAAMTFEQDDATGHVLRLFDVSGVPVAGIRPSYSHPSWTISRMGTVFGITLDDAGNIFTAHTSVYGTKSLGTAPAGTVFKIDSVTGMFAPWVSLPNSPFGGGCVGLGNLCWDGPTRNLYVSNFEDGRIYRVTSTGGSGTVLSTYSHCGDRVTQGGAPDPNDQPGFAPTGAQSTTGVGCRPWAVQTRGNKLYYSLWNQDFGQNAAGGPNQIWTVNLLPSGEFIAGTKQLIITVPAYANGVSGPVADISFRPGCECLMLGERTMTGNGQTGAHQSRTLEYCRDAAGAWSPSPRNFTVSPAIADSCAGGVDYDYRTGGRVWATSDALSFGPTIYGMSGMLQSGGSPATHWLVDADNDTNDQDKTQLGDMEIGCPTPCATINPVEILCQLNSDGTTPPANGNYTFSFTFTNNTSPPQPIQFLFFPPGVTPRSLALATPVAPGATSPVINVVLSGQVPGARICLPITFANPQIQTCCQATICIDLPRCDCAQFPRFEVRCIPGTTNYQISFIVQNLGTLPINELHIFPLPIGGPITVTPADFYFPSVPPGGIAGPFNAVISGAQGGQLCMLISAHLDGTECCAVTKCIDLPPCNPPVGTQCPFDLNADGMLDGADFVLFINSFGAGDVTVDPLADVAGGGADGLMSDGIIDGNDFVAFINAFGAGC